MSDTAKQVGLFPLTLSIGNGMAGSKTLTLALSVYTPASTMTGMAHLAQATNPPLNETFHVSGSYARTIVMNPMNEGYAVHLVGGSAPDEMETLKLNMMMDDTWTSGVASYAYKCGSEWLWVENVPVHPYYPMGPGPVIPPEGQDPKNPFNGPVVLYGVSMQDAIRQGDLQKMKNLADVAQAQVDHKAKLEAAVKDVRAALGKITNT